MTMKALAVTSLACCIAQMSMAPIIALAANSAKPAPQPPLPAYASSDDHIEGRIVHIDGKYTMSFRDVHGYLDRVRMHQGTVINPIGITLVDGMRARIYGRPGGSEFLADEIDTPYQTYNTVPVYVPYPPASLPYGYGYPGYPYATGTVIINGRGHWRR